MDIVGTILHKSKKSNKLNILCINTHESAESNLCQCFPQHTWHSLYGPNLKTWNEKFRKCPHNYILLKNGIIPLEVNFDLILSQNHYDQYAILKPIADRFKIPLITVTHTYPYKGMKLDKIKQLKGDFNVFITKNSMNAWGWSDNEGIVIEHFIDTDTFKQNPKIERKNYILSVCNQFNKPIRMEPCGYPLWERIIQPSSASELPWFHLGDSCEGMGEAAKNLNHLIDNYSQASIFINTSLLSPIPMSLLEAAACGTAIVSTATCSIPEIFTNGHDALLSNDPKELREFCIQLLKNPKEARRLGENARKTIQMRFNKEKFTNAWSKVFDDCKRLSK